jgi:hypothetical protein
MEALRGRDSWFRYHAVEDLRLDVEHHLVFPWDDRFDRPRAQAS